MSCYRIHVRVELHNDDTGQRITWSDHDHYFNVEKADGGHPDFIAIDNAVDAAIGERSPRATRGSK